VAARSGFQLLVVVSSALSRLVGGYQWDRANSKAGTAVRIITLLRFRYGIAQLCWIIGRRRTGFSLLFTTTGASLYPRGWYDPGQLRIALVTAPPNGVPLDPECKRAALDTGKLCETLGHSVEEAALPVDNRVLSDAFVTIVQVSLARVLDDAGTERGRPLDEGDVEPVTWAMMQAGTKVTSVAYSRAIAVIHQIGLAMATFHQTYDWS
jgi:hypothetical protein